MRLVFAHDHTFVRWGKRIYTPGQLPYLAWRRYLEHFSSVTVIARVREAESESEVASLGLADGPGVAFALQPVSHGLRRVVAGRRKLRASLKIALSKADAVVARVPSEYGLAAAHAARRARVPIALEVVGDAFESLWNHGSIAGKVLAPFLHWKTKRATRRASFAIYVTERYLQERYPCFGEVAKASNVMIPRVGEDSLRRRISRIRERDHDLIIGFVGTLACRYKGLDTALQALAELKRRGLECSLHVVGDGDNTYWRRVARRLDVSDRVEFLGRLPTSDAVREWLGSVDIFVQPSKTEGLPRALIEAMSCGCTSFGTTVGGIPELLPRDCLFAPGDWRGLADLVESACRESRTREDAACRNIEISGRYVADVLEEVRRDFFRKVAIAAKMKLQRRGSMPESAAS